MCDISMMYFPSLYFWLVSKACSYFQPSVVLQLSQKMSATEWSPVSRRRCSAGPQPTLTLSQETRTRHTVGLFCQSRPRPQPTQKNFYLGKTRSLCRQQSTPLGLVLGPSFTPQNYTAFLNPFAKGTVEPEVPGPFEGSPPFCNEEKLLEHKHITRKERGRLTQS